MDAVASPRAVLANAKLTFPPRHVAVIPRRACRLHHPRWFSTFKIMAKKPPLLYFVDPDPYENDDISIHIEDDANKDNPKEKISLLRKSSSPRTTSSTDAAISEEQLLRENAYDDLKPRTDVTSADDFEMKLRKPGVVYDSYRILPKKRHGTSSISKSGSEDIINLTLLEKPEVGKPSKTKSRPDYLAGRIPSVGSIISKSYKPQKSEYELYHSRPIQVSLNPKPEVMTKPDIAISAPSKSLEERDHEPKPLYHPNPGSRQKIPSYMSKFTEPAGIDLRKPSIPTDNNKTDPKPETELDRSQDMQMDSSFISQADPEIVSELKPSSDKVRSNKGTLRNVMIEEGRLNITDLRKPDVPKDSENGTELKSTQNTLLDERRHENSDLNTIILKEGGETATTSSIGMELKPKLESNTETIARNKREDLSNALLRKKPKFDVGLQETNQVIDGTKLIRDESSGSESISSEEEDWRKLEKLLKNSERVIVELTGYNDEGFFATLGSIVGFIPYQNLSLRYQFFAFESWLRKKKVDLTSYQRKVQNADTIGSIDSLSNLESDANAQTENQQIVVSANSNSTLNSGDFFLEYQQEKDTFLSSIIGQKLKVTVSVADRSTKEVVFTGLPKERQDLIVKKRKLMDRLTVGDIIKCRITRFTQFGIFVEVEGVSALIPRTEVHFDGILDLMSSLELGQTLDARVHGLDYQRNRITLSLKDVTLDPQNDGFESVIGGGMSFGGTFQEAQPEEEWEDVESLIKELEKLEEVNTISKGTFFLSSGLAPTFQVYMAPMVDGKYRFFARFGNKVQEVLVQASMDEEQMKNTILACTSRIT